ncbi:prostate and testis expressed protein 4 [Mus caroli]|uniref:Prostate and testis expressed protein 4 n=1 Tax=Mus caroli TaxID=10089 RepID=A0A6P5QGE6_MUSCR|nr:prostate and testis expressed protein 4 [Mus caroli]
MNSVTKIGTLIIVILSFLCFVEGLICNVCKMSKNSQCSETPQRCLAKPGGSCTTISIYDGPNHKESRQMCLPHCKEKQYRKGEKLIYVMCCEKNLCNSF